MDPIANMLTSIVNAQRVGKKRISLPFSSHKKDILDLLQQKEMIRKVRVQDSPSAKLIVSLKYSDSGAPRITGVKRFSKPGRRMYVKHDKIPFRYIGYGIVVLSTPEGIIDDSTARKKGIGGELVCALWA